MAIIKPDAYKHIGKIISIIEENGFKISDIKMTKMSISEAREFYKEHKVKHIFNLRENLFMMN